VNAGRRTRNHLHRADQIGVLHASRGLAQQILKLVCHVQYLLVLRF
jgi:hypothetical protein